jgi:hypothetical protein
MKNMIYVVIFLIIISCNADKTKKIDAEKSKFSTSDASELFFKNVRQRYYDREEVTAAKLNVYRLQERNKQVDQAHLNLAIVINWRYDEAYILLEPNDLAASDNISINWVNEKSKDSGNYNFSFGDKYAHFAFASQIYSGIQEGHRLFIIVNEEEIPFLHKEKDREAFRKTMKDYYRLVDLL